MTLGSCVNLFTVKGVALQNAGGTGFWQKGILESLILPSCPALFNPQHFTIPEEVSAHAWSPPAAIAVAMRGFELPAADFLSLHPDREKPGRQTNINSNLRLRPLSQKAEKKPCSVCSGNVIGLNHFRACTESGKL